MAESAKRILVVDDDPDMRNAIQRLLGSAGFAVSTLPRADELLQGDAASAADCIVLDIHMPGMSGLSAAEKLQAKGVHTPLIIMTAHDNPVMRARAMKAGAAGYLRKPFLREALLEAIDGALN